MNWDISFSNQQVTPWSGLAFLKRMIDKMGFHEHLSSGKMLPQPGSNRGYSALTIIESGWSNLPTADSAPSASPPGSSNYVGLPVGEWFELEFRYVKSDFDVANGSFQIWLNDVLIVDQDDVITVGTDTGTGDTGPWTRFEFYDPKLYGAPTFTDWEDDKGTKEVRWYTRNVKVASAKLSDGDAGDPSPPVGE